MSRPRPRTITRDRLPGWPLALPFIGYGLGWLIGLGDLVWPLAAGVMVLYLLRTSDLRLPPLFGIWLFFLAWMCASVINIDSGGRLVGFGYRGLLYAAATVAAVYAYNATTAVTIRSVGAVASVFLAVMTVYGFLGLAFPLASIRTPIALVIPAWMEANPLVAEIIVRRLTQFSPASVQQTLPRPSAPFLFTNTWGNVYPLLAPLVALYAWRERWRVAGIAALVTLVLSVVPAVLTLNRGLFVGLAVVLVVAAVHQLFCGRVTLGLMLLGATVAAGLALVTSPAGLLLRDRLDRGSSTADRVDLYRATLVESLSSPWLGHGAPRPAAQEWLPALGTQGQVWTVMFSHGLVALVLFLGWFGWSLAAGLRGTSIDASVLSGAIAATIVQSAFYGMMTGLTMSLVLSCLVLRADIAIWRGTGRPLRTTEAAHHARTVAPLGSAP